MKRASFLAAAFAATTLFVAGCSGTAEYGGLNNTSYPKFDGNRAFEYLKKQVEFGPRVPGTDAHAKTADYLENTLKPFADEVRQDKFTTSANGKSIEFRNIYAAFNKDATDWILLCAHWDTRPIADEEIDKAKASQPIDGANDGASGVAVLLETAKLLYGKNPNVGVFIALFDGEDYGPTITDMFIGAEHFARNLKTSAVVNGKQIKFRYGILLDMIGDKNLDIYKEQRSVIAAPEIVDKVWKAASDLGYSKTFIGSVKHDISDDHLPLIAAGIKTIDIIDFDYAYWHTLDDTVDKCSPTSLEKVGRTIIKVVYDEKPSAQ